jgi:serine/threonine-protein kinase
MDQLLEALEYAHRNKVVHRDIKPANILYGEDGRIQIADFGIAKVDASTLTRTGAVLDTPGYMAPEQCQGLPSDHRADIFAAGVILYELLTGEQPFRASTGIATVQQVLSLEPVKPSRLNVQVPLLLDDAVAKAIAKRREERYQSAREFASALRQVVQDRAPASGGDVDQMLTIPGTIPGRVSRPQSKVIKGVIGTAGLVAVIALVLIRFHVDQDVQSPKGGSRPVSSDSGGPSTSESAPSGEGNPAEAASLSPAEVNRQLRGIVAGVECAELEPTLTAFREVVLSGYLKPEDREKVEREIARLPGVKRVLFKVEMLAWPYCELRRLLGPYQAANNSRRDPEGRPAGVRLTARRPDAWYQEGERLVLTLTAPDLASYLYVDYFMLDGSVVHQFPVTASQRERQPPFKDFHLGEGGVREWQVAPPLGNELLVAIAAQDPLFAAPRPEMDTSKEYLPALTQALQEPRRMGSLVLADLVPITTSPATQVDKAAVPSRP